MTAVFWRCIAFATAFIPALVHAQQPTGAEINKTNQALAASNVNLRVELAGAQPRNR